MKNLLIKAAENNSILECINYENSRYAHSLDIKYNYNKEVKNLEKIPDNFDINTLIIDGLSAYLITDIDIDTILTHLEILTNSKDIVSVNIFNVCNLHYIYIYYRYNCEEDIMKYINKLYKNRQYKINKKKKKQLELIKDKFEVCKIDKGNYDLFVLVFDNEKMDLLLNYNIQIEKPIAYRSFFPIKTGVYDNIRWDLRFLLIYQNLIVIILREM